MNPGRCPPSNCTPGQFTRPPIHPQPPMSIPLTLHDRIDHLSDEGAAQYLRVLAESLSDDAPAPQAVRPAMEEQFDGRPSGSEAPSEGEVARAALHVLAEAPPHGERLQALLDGPKPETFDLGTSVAIGTLAVVVLQTQVELEASDDGGWHLRVEKPSASEDLIQSLAELLLRTPE